MLAPHLREGDILARRYQLRERIGSGGMSVIWRAWDEALHRTVAVKVLDGPLGTDHANRDLIRREARAAARIEHPQAIRVYDYGETVTPRGRIAAYVVMQLLDGSSLASRLEVGPLPWQEAVAVAATVADVLATAHREGVVHRDVTPENVMLTSDGVKLLDFGIAADVGQREDTLTFGTPPYVAPERIAGAQASGATDVYSLGVLLFESLTGTIPYATYTWDDLPTISGPPGPIDVPGLPSSIADVCLRCVALDPADRPPVAAVAAVLAAPPARSRRVLWLLSLLILPVVAVVWGVLASRGDPPVATGAPATTSQSRSAPAAAPPVVPSTAASHRQTRSPGPVSPPPTTPSTVDVKTAAAAVDSLLDQGRASGAIRSDVAEDLRHQVDALVSNQTSPGPRIDNLRRSITDRQREQAITPAAATQLDAAIVTLGGALGVPA